MLSDEAKASLTWAHDYVEAQGALPAKNVFEFEIARHFAEFGFATSEECVTQFRRSPFLAFLKVLRSVDSRSVLKV